jgi:hypothetical protein
MRSSTTAAVMAACALALAGGLGPAGPARAQSEMRAQSDIPLAPEPPPLSGAPAPDSASDSGADSDPVSGASTDGDAPLVIAPEAEPQGAPAPADAVESAPSAPAEPASQAGDGTGVSSVGIAAAGLPLPPRRPPVPASFTPPPAPAPDQPPRAEPSSAGSQRFESETAQRFGRDLSEPRAGFARVEGDMFWDAFTIGRDGRIECTTRAALYGSSLAASFKEKGIWVPGEPLKLSVPCETPDGRTIGLACVAQDRAPVLDLSCRIDDGAG